MQSAGHLRPPGPFGAQASACFVRPPARKGGWAALLALGLSWLGAAAAGQRPDILFLLTDDQRADTIRALGNPSIQTPNLDGLAAEGTSFLRAYCMGSALHGAVCVPSRAMLMSGRTLFRAPENLQDVETWPARLGRVGYRTFITGKWHNQAPSLLASFTEGKAIFLGGMTDQSRVKVSDMGSQRTLINERIENRFSSELFAAAAIEFLRSVEPGRPFCLYVAFTAPHDPRTPPPEFRRPYDLAPPPLPPNFLPQHPFNNGEMLVRDEKLAPWPRTPDTVQEHLAAYYGMITHLDAQVGRILQALRETGRYQQTVIVFASDQGLAIGSHGLFGKQNLYEHSVRAPLMIAGPGLPKGRKTEAFCYLLDLYPTLCELAGVTVPESSEGRSLAPLLRARGDRGRDCIFTAYRQGQRAVRDERFKLIRYPHLNKSQLFDLRRDPAETSDLSADPRHAKRLGQMTALLARQQALAGDTLPLATNRPLPLQLELPAAGRDALPRIPN
jgi:arylsulfatase A-like enzyme